MGSFITNVQVHCGGRPRDAVQADLVAALTSLMGKTGFVATTEPELSDRSLVIVPGRGKNWLTVYDQEADSQDTDILQALVEAASRVTPSGAVGVLVHDSDVLYLLLARDGDLVDSYSSDPDFFAEDDEEESAEMTGNPAAWAPLLPESKDTTVLKTLFGEEDAIAEKVLSNLGELLRWDRELAFLSYRDVEELEDIDASDELLALPRILLHFRQEGGTQAKEILANGPPNLEAQHMGGILNPLTVGQTWELVLSGVNRGGAAQGTQLWIDGDALQQGLLEINRQVKLEVGFGPGRGEAAVQLEPTDVKTFDADGNVTASMPGLTAKADDLAIPAGLSAPDVLQQGTRAMQDRATTVNNHASFVVRLSGEVKAPGVGAICVALGANAADGEQAQWDIDIVAEAPPRKPLRCAEVMDINVAYGLRSLEHPLALFGFAALGCTPAAAAPALVPAFERWAEVLARLQAPKLRIFAVDDSDGGKYRKGEIEAAGLGKNRSWSRYRNKLKTGDYGTFSASSQGEYNDELQARAPFGFAFNTYQWLGRTDDTKSLFVTFLCPTDLGGVEEEAQLRGLLDELMAQGPVMQAFVGRWKLEADISNASPYEQACGFDGARGQAWCRRYLRGVTETMWLGPDLVSRLGSSETLEPVAHVTAIGKGVRLQLREGRTLDDLERVLAPLLPSKDSPYPEVLPGRDR